MFSDIIDTPHSNPFALNYMTDYFNDLVEKDYINLENCFNRNFYSNEQQNLFIDDSKSTFFSSKSSKNWLISFDEDIEEKQEDDFNLVDISYSNLFPSENLKGKEWKPVFKVKYPKKYSLFTNTVINSDLVKEEKNFLNRKRVNYLKQRRDNNDNMRKKIKRGFFNTALIGILNKKLENIGSNKYLEKFPQIFIADVDRKRNKKIFSLTLKEILEKNELYKKEKESGVNNYLHNLKVLQSEDIKNDEEFKIILNKKISELFEEYINSDEFKIGEINRLIKNNMNDDYMKRYIYLAKHLIEFFSK